MSKFKLWMCKKMYKHVKWHVDQAVYYEKKLKMYLKDLDADEFFMFGIATGYCEKEQQCTASVTER